MSTQISAGGVTIRQCLVFIVATIISAVAFAGSSELSAVPGLRSYAEFEFPQTLRLSTIGDGYATIAFTISDRGRIDDSVTLEASHPAFAQTVMKVLPRFF